MNSKHTAYLLCHDDTGYFCVKNLFLAVCALGLCLATTTLQALQIYYADDRPTALAECDNSAYQGDVDGSIECYQQIFADPDAVATDETPALLMQAMAASALKDFRQANRLYREAAVIVQTPRVLTNWGDLYLRTHQYGEAASLYREALLEDADYLPARVGLASSLASQYAGGARDEVLAILDDHPDSVPANLLIARMLLEAQRTDDGRQILTETLQRAKDQNLPALEIYALLASAELLDSTYPGEWTQKSLDENPAYGDIYAIPAHFYIITYRYREAVDLYRKAVEAEPTLASAHSQLGINSLRINDINAARYHLMRAYAEDPFNTETVNTLRLLDDIDDMRVSYADVLPETSAQDQPRAQEPIGRMLLRLNQDSVDALEPYVIELVSDSIRSFTERYDFALEKPVVVELYHNHDDFGVRTVSTPGVGLLGVTFGYVVAMDSPKARSTDDFHWGSTLWHEMAHVFTLEAANHLLPRWFSEGISVYEEWNTGPLPSRELPIQVLSRFSEGAFLPVDRLDSGFVRPTYEGQVNVSYMQAGLICDFIAGRWGHEALVTMLKAFANGDSTKTALRRAINIDSTVFDSLFNAHVAERYETILTNQQHWQQLGQIIQSSMTRLARTEEQGRQPPTPQSLEALQQIIQQRINYYPEHVGNGTAWLALAELHRYMGNDAQALEAHWQWYVRGGALPAEMQRLARDLEAAGREDDAFAVLESLNWVMPYTVAEHRRLGDYYLQRGEPNKAIREFNALLGIRPEAESVVLLGKAQAYRQQGDQAQARRNVLLALERTPFFRDAQKLLLELNESTPGE